MPEQYNRQLRAVEGTERAAQCVRTWRQPNTALRRRFVLVPGGAHSQDDLGSVQYLRKLEHENAELRNTAIKLALEIQALGGIDGATW
jgi:hypothetical protein